MSAFGLYWIARYWPTMAQIGPKARLRNCWPYGWWGLWSDPQAWPLSLTQRRCDLIATMSPLCCGGRIRVPGEVSLGQSRTILHSNHATNLVPETYLLQSLTRVERLNLSFAANAYSPLGS